MEAITRTNDDIVDAFEVLMIEAALNENNDNVFFGHYPLNHFFYPGLYERQILMPKGHYITSMVHKTCHPFRVMQGSVYVKMDNNEWERIEAPYRGTTQPGTRRILYIEQDTVWETSHVLPFIKGNENELPPEELAAILYRIDNEILEPYENKLLGGQLTRNNLKLTV